MARGWNRRSFLVHGAIATAGCGVLANVSAGSPEPSAKVPVDPVVPAWFPHQDPERVREVVSVSHGNFERVRELVEESLALAKAEWDWGFGDWESALGAASHTGGADPVRDGRRAGERSGGL